MRPGANGTVTSCPASCAAFSTAAHPPRTIRSASETFLPPDCEPLKSCWICSRVGSTSASAAGSLTSQSFCGARRIRAPLAPPRLSVPRKLAADAHAVETSWETDRPESRMRCLERGDVRVVDQLVVDRRDRVLPQLRLAAPTGRGSARADPCRGAAACTRPWRRRPRARPGARGSAGRSARRSGRSAAPGPWSASSARAASTGRARRARCPGPRGSSASTARRRPGSWSAPSRSRTGSPGSRCPTSSGCWSRRPRARW